VPAAATAANRNACGPRCCHPRAAPADCAENNEQRDRDDIADRTDTDEASEPTDANDPADPIESAEPAEPIDSTDSDEAMLRTELRERIDHSDDMSPSWTPVPTSATRGRLTDVQHRTRIIIS
jgi:hypothetical protein